MSKARRDRRPLFEVQIHPGSVRWNVRYLFLTRRHLWALGLAGGSALLLVLFGLLVLPGVIGGLVRAREYQSLLTERELQGQTPSSPSSRPSSRRMPIRRERRRRSRRSDPRPSC